MRKVSGVISFAVFMGGEALRRNLASTDSHRPDADILHWQDIQKRGVNTTGMIPSLVRVREHDAVRLFTYSPKEDLVISKVIQETGAWETDHVSEICKVLESVGGNFLDVGANIGTYTIPLVQCIGNQHTAFAVEAEPGNVEHVMASVLANGYENVVVIPNAVGSPSDPPTIRMGYLRKSKGATMRTENVDMKKSTYAEVKLTTLDAIAERSCL